MQVRCFGFRFRTDWTQKDFLFYGGISVSIVSAFLILASLNRIESDEYGVQYNFHEKDLKSEVQEEGLYNGPPGFQFIKFRSVYTILRIPLNTDYETYFCVSKDGLIVDIEVSFQYLPIKEHIHDIVLLYRKDSRYSKQIMNAALSAVNHACGEFEVDSFQRNRTLVQSRMFEYLKVKLEGSDAAGMNVSLGYEKGLWAQAIDLSLLNYRIPPRYQAAVDAKQAAEVDIILARNEREQRVMEASTRLASAETQAQVTLLQAQAEATVILKTAQYRANATLLEFEKEGQTYSAVKESLNFTTQGFLSYLNIRALEAMDSTEVLSIEPAISSFKDKL